MLVGDQAARAPQGGVLQRAIAAGRTGVGSATHRHEQVFTDRGGRSSSGARTSRRAVRPAADGTSHHPRPAVVLAPAAPGLTFHGLRHSHKTWLIADQIPEVGQARRLGHRIPDKIQHVYSCVAPELEARLLDALQQRWIAALTELAATSWAAAVNTTARCRSPPTLSPRQPAATPPHREGCTLRVRMRA